MTSKFLLASDFDQTLSFNDSGVVLSERIGLRTDILTIQDSAAQVATLSDDNAAAPLLITQ